MGPLTTARETSALLEGHDAHVQRAVALCRACRPAAHQLAEYVRRWQPAEALGYDWASVFDHFVPIQSDPLGPCFEGPTPLAAMTAGEDLRDGQADSQPDALLTSDRGQLDLRVSLDGRQLAVTPLGCVGADLLCGSTGEALLWIRLAHPSRPPVRRGGRTW